MKHPYFLAFVIAASLFSLLWTFGYGVYRQSGQVAGTNTANPVTGLIVPHHNLAESVIVTAIDNIDNKSDYTHVVVLGPNHFAPESENIITNSQLADFPIDTDIVTALQQTSPHIDFDPELVQNEHSLIVPITHLYQQLPNVQFIPLMVSPHYYQDHLNQIADDIRNLLPSTTLYVVSVDFSHNTQLADALDYNQRTIQVIQDLDYNTLVTLDDHYLDSPIAMALFLKIMQLQDATNWQEYEQSHSSMLLDAPTSQGTSYITGIFTNSP